MNFLCTLAHSKEWLRHPAHPDLPPFDPGLPGQQDADAHLVCVIENRIHARCSLWWSTTPELSNRRAGIIGHYAAVDGPAGKALLEQACAILQSKGLSQVIGPMDGSTWRRYRLVTEAGAHPPFFLEPVNPPAWPRQWESAGFLPCAAYFSAITDDLTQRDERLTATAARLKNAGVRIRPFDLEEFDDELRRIYSVARVSFAHNFLYTPLDEAGFILLYQPIRPLINPALCLLAEDAGGVVGFIFCLPDALQGGQPDTLILKTVAVQPGRAYAGLGALLIGQVHEAGHRLGYRRMIHALMHESNQSLNVSARYTRIFRRYTLFSRQLATP